MKVSELISFFEKQSTKSEESDEQKIDQSVNKCGVNKNMESNKSICKRSSTNDETGWQSGHVKSFFPKIAAQGQTYGLT